MPPETQILEKEEDSLSSEKKLFFQEEIHIPKIPKKEGEPPYQIFYFKEVGDDKGIKAFRIVDANGEIWEQADLDYLSQGQKYDKRKLEEMHELWLKKTEERISHEINKG